MPARQALRLGQETAALVVAKRLDVHARAFCDLADPHGVTIDPYLGTESKREPQAAAA
jgi:hypothetical protein